MRWYSCAVAARFVVLVVCGGSVALGGSLTPPVGPVGPTFKTLGETEPRIAINSANTPGDADSQFRIAQPGSYYLTGNIIGVSGRRGIEIAANNVTIDMMGFTLSGLGGSLEGIATDSAPHSGITVRNGTLTVWGRQGLHLDVNASNTDCTLENLRVTFCQLGGIIAPDRTLMRGCHARNNFAVGLQVGNDSAVEFCLAQSNSGHGIAAGTACAMTDCSSRSNIGDGINAGEDSQLSVCVTGQNGGNGITGDGDNTIINCTAATNTGIGIAVSGRVVIRGCDSTSNGNHGISVGVDSVVAGNSCDGNGTGVTNGAGIFAGATDCRLEGNHCSDNDIGIDLNTTGCIAVRNTCSGNTTNWEVASGSYLLVVNGTFTATGFSGSSGGTALGSTDPNANFSY